MNPASHASVALTHPLPPPRKTLTDEETAHLREVLKRCSAATFQAACQFWKEASRWSLKDSWVDGGSAANKGRGKSKTQRTTTHEKEN